MRKTAGFTLIELLVVIVIIGILSFVFITKFSFSPTRLAAARTKLINDIRYAQSLALGRGAVYGIEFSTDTDTYSLYKGTPDVKITDPSNPAGFFVVVFPNIKELSDIDLVSANFDGTNRVEFDYKGTPRSGAGASLLSTGSIVIQNPSGQYTVYVSPETGRTGYQ